ncbi:MAG TPA: hypothetical protein VLA45_01825, partial [Paracoccaceae bacterium]|nr:hypothetical protein [Paracoccaceae bacterium]
MTQAGTHAASAGAVLDTRERRRARITGAVLVALGGFVVAVFGLRVSGDATFRLSRPGDPLALPDLVVPAGPVIHVAAALLVFLGARLFLRGGGRGASLSLGIGLALAVMAFLVWATADKSFSLTGMLQAMVVRAIPIALGGLAGCFA